MEKTKKEKRKFRFKKEYAYHAISVCLIIGSILLSIFHFDNVAVRAWQACLDVKNSALYYVQNFGDAFRWIDEVTAIPTVNKIPDGMTAVLPLNFEELKAFIVLYGKTLVSSDNLLAFIDRLWLILNNLSWILLLFGLPFIGVIGIILLVYWCVDNKHGVDSLPKKIFCKLEDVLIFPPYRFIKGYIKWLFAVPTSELDEGQKKGADGAKEKEAEKYLGRYYKYVLAAIWAWNLNVVTIVLECVAFYLYVVWSMDYVNVFVQIAKLGVDLTATVLSMPAIVWVIVAFKRFDKWRRERGYEKLEDNEAENQDFLREHPENILATGEPRSGKTQGITDMTISQDDVFRSEAENAAFKRRMQFPFFPWVNLEQTIIQFRNNVPGFNLEFLRTFLEIMETFHIKGDQILKKTRDKWWAKIKEWGYTGKEGFCFDYDTERYPTKYNDALRIVPLFKTLRYYAEEFYIYTSPTPLSVGNYPIKFCYYWENYGNRPLRKTDYFRKTPEEREKAKQFNHRFYFDMARLGIKKDPNNPYINNLEVGSETIAEVGKERGNQNSRTGESKKDKHCNASNDLFEMDAKMRSHATTIDYFTYFRIFADEQRAMELLASLREIGSEINFSRKNQKMKVLMPCFEFEELLYNTATLFVKKIFDFMDSRHGKQTLFMYLVNRLYSPLFNHYWRRYNEYSSYDVELKIVNHATSDSKQREERSKKFKYHISTMKVRSDVYDTAYFSTFYREKFKKSKAGGINQIPQWSGLTPSVEELRSIGSHNFDEVFKQMDLDDVEVAAGEAAKRQAVGGTGA